MRIPGHLEVSALPLCWWNTGTTWEPVRNANSRCPQTHRMRICISPRSPGDWSICCNLRNAALICWSKSFRPVDSQPQLHSRIVEVGRQELLENTPRMLLQWSWGCLCTDSFRHCPVFLGARMEIHRSLPGRGRGRISSGTFSDDTATHPVSPRRTQHPCPHHHFSGLLRRGRWDIAAESALERGSTQNQE